MATAQTAMQEGELILRLLWTTTLMGLAAIPVAKLMAFMMAYLSDEQQTLIAVAAASACAGYIIGGQGLLAGLASGSHVRRCRNPRQIFEWLPGRVESSERNVAPRQE